MTVHCHHFTCCAILFYEGVHVYKNLILLLAPISPVILGLGEGL